MNCNAAANKQCESNAATLFPRLLRGSFPGGDADLLPGAYSLKQTFCRAHLRDVVYTTPFISVLHGVHYLPYFVNVRSRFCTGCFILKMYQILYTIPVSGFLSGLICSVHIDQKWTQSIFSTEQENASETEALSSYAGVTLQIEFMLKSLDNNGTRFSPDPSLAFSTNSWSVELMLAG